MASSRLDGPSINQLMDQLKDYKEFVSSDIQEEYGHYLGVLGTEIKKLRADLLFLRKTINNILDVEEKSLESEALSVLYFNVIYLASQAAPKRNVTVRKR